MAGKRKKPLVGAPGKKLRPEDIKLLWRKVPTATWLTLLQRVNREGKWALNGHVIKGCCPYHDDNTPSFYLNFDKCMGKCFGACGKVVTDLVQLFAKVMQSSYTQALTFLATEVHIDDLLGPAADELSEYNQIQEMKKAAAMAMREIINEYLRDKPSHLAYIAPALTYLVHGRHIPLDLITALPLGIYGKPEHIKKYIPEEYHESYDAYFKKADGPAYWGAPVFHYNNAPGSISRFKIRRMKESAATELTKYSKASEIPYDTVRGFADKSFYIVEDPFTTEMGVFGLHHYNRMIGAEDTNVYVTEGEFDALSVMVAQLKEGRNDFMVFCFGGNGGTGLSFLRELGIRTVWVVQDAPSKKGDDVVKRLLMNSKNHIGDAVNKALDYRIFYWSPEMRGGDLDEAVQLMGYEAVCTYLCTERKAYFSTAYNWAVRKCDEALADMRKNVECQCQELGESTEDIIQKENLKNTLTTAIAEEVRNWFNCVHSQVDRLSFIQKYSVSEGIDFEKLSDVNSTLYSLDTVEGAVARLQDALREHVEIVYYENVKSGTMFTLWSKSAYETAAIPMNDSGMELTMSQYLGKDVLLWARQLLRGSSLILSKPSGDEIKDNKTIAQNVMFLLRRVMMNMVSDSMQVSKLQIVGQGIHYNNIPAARANGTVYFVNGTKVFKGKYNPASGAAIEWEFINNTVDENLLFTLHPSKKWSDIEDVAELYAGTQVNLQEQFNNIRTILDGWKFEHHAEMRDYLAAWIMSIPIQRAMGMVNITFLTGESTSGKTSFVRGLLGGYGSTGYDVPSIVECAKFSSDATPAWIYQEMDQSALMLGLDEAESRQGTAHSTRVNDIQQMMFSIPTGGARMSRGGTTADSRADYFLQMPVIMAAINMSSDPVFLTRVVVVYTEKDLQRKNVGDYIADNFTDSQIAKIRLDTTRGLLAHIPALNSRMLELRAELSKVELPVKVTSRYINSLLPALTVYSFLGYDATKLFSKIVNHNRNLLETLNMQDFQSELINAVLYTEGVRAAVDDNITGMVSPKTLITSGDYTILNNSGCGVKILPERGWLVILWRDAKYTQLTRTAFNYMDIASLKEAISKNAYVVNTISSEDHKYIVDTLGCGDVKNSSVYSVISLNYLMSQEQCDLQMTAKTKGTSGGNSSPPPMEDIPIDAYNDEFSASANQHDDDGTSSFGNASAAEAVDFILS